MFINTLLLLFIMHAAVNFNNKFRRMAEKIGDEPVDDLLASEFETSAAIVSKSVSESPFRESHLFS